MYTRKKALALAKQFRTCPPPFIRNHPDFKVENENHLKICPFCSIGSLQGVQDWQELSEKLKTQFLADDGQGDILSGQIRQVKPELGCWRDELYYNPPVVLVLNCIGDIDDAVQVAQIWQDTALAAPGDLVLPDDLIAGFEELFIETWNIYTLRKSDLGGCLGTVSSQVLAQALKMNQSPEELPDWARRPLPMVDEDPRIYFRKVEMETGYTFAATAVAALMDKVQKRDFFIFSAATLIKKIKQYIPGIDWDWVPDTVEECLAALRFGPESLTLSAADRDHKEIIAVYLELKNGAVSGIRPLECIIHHAGSEPDGHTISGEIPGLPDDLTMDAFKCHIKNTEEKVLFPGHWSWDSKGKNFIAQFDRPLKPHETVTITVVHDTADGSDR